MAETVSDMFSIVEQVWTKWLSVGVVVFSANAVDVLLEAFVEGVEDGVRGSQCEEVVGGEVNWEFARVSLYCRSSSRSGVG